MRLTMFWEIVYVNDEKDKIERFFVGWEWAERKRE